MKKSCKYCNKLVWRNQNIFCDKKCFNDFLHEEYIRRWKAGEVSGGESGDGEISNYVRRYIVEKYENKCSRCGWHEINPTTGKVPLQIEHDDGNPYNHVEENLRLLCPNCHSLTPTYGALNRGSGRKNRKR